ncbi:MAG TPA: protein phosphatase 2C domain-containing protein, partial [Candidatus Polarisedimenticolia bacterium]|nr:protein phosphatase 2C domain-containing protein [Candidatus Polarisedimenticolia bacterium]
PQVVSTSNLIKWSAWTDRGKRPNNEDSFLALNFDAREVHRLGKSGDASTAKTDFAFAVSDGMGGALAGEYASRIAMEKITTMLPRSFKQSATGFAVDYDDVLTELFGEVHKALVYLGGSYEECHGMEATLTLCWFTPGWMHFGHIGDSRLYYLPAKENKIKQLSHDDTHVGWLFRNGKLNEREARTHPRRSVLQKALGGGNQFVDPQLGAVGYENGDMFLLCTDGLVEGLYDDHVVEILRDTNSNGEKLSPAQRLVTEAVQKSGRDNTTALVIEVI